MGSARRQRTRILTVRLTDDEDARVQELADALGVTRAEIARAILFDREPAPSVTPCSDRHGTQCTLSHRDLVDGYRDERARQELASEALTGRYPGDEQLARENGLKLVNFAQWLRWHRGASQRPDDTKGAKAG